MQIKLPPPFLNKNKHFSKYRMVDIVKQLQRTIYDRNMRD